MSFVRRLRRADDREDEREDRPRRTRWRRRSGVLYDTAHPFYRWMNRGRGMSVIDGGRDAPLRSSPSILYTALILVIVVGCVVLAVLYW